MLLRNSISNTKKFFLKTIDNFKSFLSKDNAYEKIPKTPKIEACSKELDNFYVEFTSQWDSHKGKLRNRAHRKPRRSQEVYTKLDQQKNYAAKENVAPVIASQSFEFHPQKLADGDTVKRVTKVRNDYVTSRSPTNVVQDEFCAKSVKESRVNMISQKLKELELMDKGNVDYKMDIEEVLHYYSRLTCPAYMDIVDKFIKEICTEFLGPQVSPQVNILRPPLK
ncbi:uncharacterized protein LOC141605936 [Silene latifolia]|uniref:uncharacterized protein LOC141605936 n=1 Tax=Silene latifolia TaxID=37657 RepID=UPI003D773F64